MMRKFIVQAQVELEVEVGPDDDDEDGLNITNIVEMALEHPMKLIAINDCREVAP